jgi:hypothetical protein
MMVTLWEGTSELKPIVDKLNLLIPEEGSVLNKEQNKHLELFRIAQNCYYDLYNNGLGNRRKEFYKLYKLASYGLVDDEEFLNKVELKFNAFILNACEEQNIN